MPRRWQPRDFDPALPELRRRTAWLIRHLDSKTRAFVHLMPILLAGRFRRAPFDREPPGVRLAPRRHRWGHLCARLDFPPPTGVSTSRPLVQSVVLAPRGDGRIEVLIVPVDAIANADVGRLTARVDAIIALAQRHCPALDVRLAPHAQLPASIIPWAAVCAGEFPPFNPGPVDLHEVALRAPTPLARCLSLLVDERCPRPLEVLRTTRGPARAEAFVARWSDHELARTIFSLEDSLPALKEVGAALRRACALALRRVPLRERRPLRAMVRHELFSSAIPTVLRSVLERLIHGRSAVERHDGSEWTLTVDDTVLASAPTLDQLRARSLNETPLFARPGTPWARVAHLLTSPARRSLAIIEAGSASHLVVSLTGSRRLRARRVDVQGLLRFVLRSRHAAEPAEVVSSLGSDQALVGRIAQIIRLAGTGATAVEVGERVLIADTHHVRAPALRNAFARPRLLSWLPADHELFRSLRRPSTVPLPTVHATAWPLGADRAAVFYVDPSGAVLREEVTRVGLEPLLVESRELLRHADPPALLSVTVHPGLSALAGRRLDVDLPALPLEVECDWPYTIRIWLDGECFCAPGDLSWTALSESILSRWPPGTWGRVGVRRVGFIRPPPTPSPLHVLAVRSRVLRRVAAGLRRLTRVLNVA